MKGAAPRPGAQMAAEVAEAPGVFAATLKNAVNDERRAALRSLGLPALRGFHTIARGSSDAAAQILAYEFMRETGLPMTTLPPSVYSLGRGVRLADCGVLVISQSGASPDLVAAARGARASGARVVAMVNQAGSAVGAVADVTLPIGAGVERAIPATKSVIGAIAAGMALLAEMVPGYAARAEASATALAGMSGRADPDDGPLVAALAAARHVYVIGRDTGFGAAQELALKLKECGTLHAEAYSGSEVLHGPLQLATNPLLVLVLDTGLAAAAPSLELAAKSLTRAGATVMRLAPPGGMSLTPAAGAAALLIRAYPLILNVALAKGLDPDHPTTLSKVTQTT